MMEEKKNEPIIGKPIVSEISNFVKYWLVEYGKNPQCELKVLDKLKVVFSNDSDYQIKILVGNAFGRVFLDKLGKRRMPTLKYLLMKIDPARYGPIQY